MNITVNTVDYATKANEIIDNFIKTKKIFTAFHVTIILRKCGYMVKHHEVRDVVNAYDITTKGYTKTLSNTHLFKVAANLYHPVTATAQDLKDFEKDIEDKQIQGKENTAIVVPSLAVSQVVVHSVISNGLGPVQPITPKPYSSIRLKSDTVKISADARNRVCIPAKVVRKYFKAGDMVGIISSPVNMSIELFKSTGKYNTVLTVDSYDNIRIHSKHMHKANGDITVNFNDNLKTIVFV